MKITFLLVLALATGVSMLHSLSYRVKHTRGWTSCMLSFVSNIVAKTQNLYRICTSASIQSRLTRTSWREIGMLRCPISAPKHCLFSTKQHHPTCNSFFISMGTFIYIYIYIYISFSDPDQVAVRVQAHEVSSIGTSLLFKNFAVQFWGLECRSVRPLSPHSTKGMSPIGLWI